MLLDRAHGRLGIEGQHRDQRCAGLQAGQDAGLVTEVVEERVDAQITVGAGHLTARGPRRRRRQRLPVRAQHALAAAGGAGREQDVRDVVGCYGGGSRIGSRKVGPAGDELVPGAVVLVEGHPHDVPQRRQVGRGPDRRPVGPEELAHRDQQRRLGAGQDVGGLAGGVAGVQRDDNRARVVRGQAGDHPVPGIRRPDGHPVSGGNAVVDHRRGGPAHLVAQPGEGQCLLRRDQRVVVGKRTGDPVQHRRSGLRDLVIDAPPELIARLLFPPIRKLRGAHRRPGHQSKCLVG